MRWKVHTFNGHFAGKARLAGWPLNNEGYMASSTS